MIDSIIKGFEVWTDAQGVKSKGRVKSIDNISLEGISRLRGIILELAIQGKLTSQMPETENAEIDINTLVKAKNTLIEKGLIKKEKTLDEIAEKGMLFEIPGNWSWIKLGLIGITNIGLTYSPNDVSNDGLIVLRSSNIQNGEIDLTDLVRVKKEVDDKVLVEKGDLLICARNGSRQLVGKCALIQSTEEPMAFGAFMAIFRCQFNEYLKLFIESPTYRKNLEGVSTTTINQITQDNLRNTVIPVPPFEEQKRIVEKVKELMTLCDKLEKEQTKNLTTHHHLVKCLLETLTQANDADEIQSSWEKISQHFDTLFCTLDSIEKLKETILQLAVMGKLVKQDPNDAAASDMLKKLENEKRELITRSKIQTNQFNEQEPFPIPSMWQWTYLDNISLDVHYGYNAAADDLNKAVRLLRITDIQNDRVNWETVPGCEINQNQISNYLLENGDILIARTGGTIGKSYLVENINLKAVFASYLIRIRKLPSSYPDFIKLYLGSPLYWNQLYDSSMGTGQPNVNGTSLKKLIIPFPPIEEQKRIVAKVSELFALCETINTKLINAQKVQNALSETITANV